MTYITNANEKSVLHAIAKVIVLDGLDLDIYKYPLDILSVPEKKHLSKIRELFKNFDLFIDRIYEKSIKVDTKSLVYEGGRPAYHKLESCEKLNSDYVNYPIPEEIKARGDKEISKYREWFKENEHLIEKDHELFETRIQAVFFIKNPKSIEIIERVNSGHTDMNNQDLNIIECDIDKLINASNEYYTSSQRVKKLIHQFGHQSHRTYEDKETSSVIKIWHQYKADIKDNLITYYRVRFNPDLKFQGKLLDALGFAVCGCCA